MKPTHRRLALFLVMDAVVIAGLLVWWFGRGTPPQPAVAPPVAATPVAVAASTAVEPEQGALPHVLAAGGECHGTWNGQPFWLRLSAPDPELNGNRRLHLVYSPPAQAEVDGAAIHDSPILVVDGHLRIVQWDNRDGATGVLVDDPGYRVTRELHTAGSDATALKTRALKQPLAWDLRLAPVLALLQARSDGSWSVPAVDFWGPRAGERLQIEGTAAGLTVAGTAYTVQWAADGRASAVLDAQGQPVIAVTNWK